MTVVFAAAGLIVGVIGAVLAVVAMNRARQMAAATAKRIRSELIASGPLDPRAVRDVAVVRYDALEEMAGQLSFSVALLNAHGDGVVLTSINGRTETRTYAKVVADGKGVHQLSPEEQQAVRSAQLGHGPPTLLTQAPRLVGGHGPVRPATAADADRARAAAQHATHGPGEADRVRPAAPPASPGRAEPDGRHAAPAATADFAPRREPADGQRRVNADGGAKPGKLGESPAGTAPPAEGDGAGAGAPATKPGPSGTKPGPSGTKPSGTKPSGTKPAGSKPAGSKPSGSKPAGPAASEEPPGETTAPGNGKPSPDRPTGSGGAARGPAKEPADRRVRRGA